MLQTEKEDTFGKMRATT